MSTQIVCHTIYTRADSDFGYEFGIYIFNVRVCSHKFSNIGVRLVQKRLHIPGYKWKFLELFTMWYTTSNKVTSN